MAARNHGQISLGGGQAVEYEETASTIEDVETHDEAEKQGPSDTWNHWHQLIKAAFVAEKRFRDEGKAAERSYFGDENATYSEKEFTDEEGRTNIIHANIEVLKPLVYSETPEPIVRRRFGGDGGANDATDRIAALTTQRLAEYLIETSGFSQAMELSRDDWLVPGRGTVRVLYEAKFSTEVVKDQVTGQPVMDAMGNPVTKEVKSKERIKVRHWPWQRVLYGPSGTWDDLPWIAFETQMTKKQVRDRFDGERVVSEEMSYPVDGLKGKGKNDIATDEMAGWEPDDDEETSRTKSASAHDQCVVYEIWERASGKVIWWSPHYRDDVLDQIDDPLQIEGFYNTPKPLLAATKGGSMLPRPDTAYYQARADEIDIATKKLKSILEAISVSGFYPGAMVEQMKTLLNGKSNKMIPIKEWTAFMEKAGTNGIVQWLPIDQFIKAAQALNLMRESAKQGLYEISGISDIIRGQSDPTETLGAQQLKGNYANLRLRDKQSKMQHHALAAIQIMVEIAVEHFDPKTIVDIVNISLLPTDADLESANYKVQQSKMQHSAAAQAAQQTGQPVPPEPEIPFFEQTSWERVFATLKDDMRRKFTLSMETNGTVLDDAEEDKRQRVEFLQAFSGMADSLFPMAQSGIVDMKVIKELLLFAVRGFPKSRTLEGMLSSLPDKMNTEPKEDTQVTVAKIRGETDKMLAQFKAEAEAKENEADRAHDLRLKGVSVMADSLIKDMETQPA